MPSRLALPTVGAYLEHLETSGEASRALRRQRSWALREAVLFAAARRVRGAGAGGAVPGGELTDDERARAVARSAGVSVGELFAAPFVDDWLEHADPVLRGVTTRSGATQRARVSSLRALAAFSGLDLPEHRHPKPGLRPVLTPPEIASALSALTRPLPGRGSHDHARLAAVLAVMSVWPARSAELTALEITHVRRDGSVVHLALPDDADPAGTDGAVGAVGAVGGEPRVLRGAAAERLLDWLTVRESLLAALEGGPVRSLWVSIKSNSRPGGPRGSLPLPPGMPLKPRGLQRAYARSVEAANAVYHGHAGFPLPRSLDLLRRSILAAE